MIISALVSLTLVQAISPPEIKTEWLHQCTNGMSSVTIASDSPVVWEDGSYVIEDVILVTGDRVDRIVLTGANWSCISIQDLGDPA